MPPLLLSHVFPGRSMWGIDAATLPFNLAAIAVLVLSIRRGIWLVLQRKEFDVLVLGQPGLGVRPLGDLVAIDVVVHQHQGQAEGQTRDLHRSLEQSHGAVQRQLRRFFWRSRRVRVMNK